LQWVLRLFGRLLHLMHFCFGDVLRV